MKLKELGLKNFGIFEKLSLKLSPFMHITRPIGYGKSTLRDSIQLLFKGTCRRIKHKKYMTKMARRGSKGWTAKLITNELEIKRTVSTVSPSQKELTKLISTDILDCVTDMFHFEKLEPRKRLEIIQQICGVNLKGETLKILKECELLDHQAETVAELVKEDIDKAIRYVQTEKRTIKKVECDEDELRKKLATIDLNLSEYTRKSSEADQLKHRLEDTETKLKKYKEEPIKPAGSREQLNAEIKLIEKRLWMIGRLLDRIKDVKQSKCVLSDQKTCGLNPDQIKELGEQYEKSIEVLENEIKGKQKTISESEDYFTYVELQTSKNALEAAIRTIDVPELTDEQTEKAKILEQLTQVRQQKTRDAWSKTEEALKTRIPQISSGGFDPTELTKISNDLSGFKLVLEPDGTVLFKDNLLELCSEGEMLCAGIAIGLVIARRTCNFLIIDRFETISPVVRSKVLSYLKQAGLDTCIILEAGEIPEKNKDK